MRIIRVILVIILAYIAIGFIEGIFEGIYEVVNKEAYNGNYYITAFFDLICTVALLLISGYYIDKFLHRQFSDYIKYDKSTRKLLLYSFVIAALMFAFIWIADRALSSIFDDSYYEALLRNDIKDINTLGEYAVYFVLMTFGAAITEEIFFKGLCYTYLREKYNIYLSIFLSTLIFFAFHPLPNYIVTSIVYSVITCLIYEKTKSLLTTMLIHFLYNAICFFEIIIYYK